MSGHRCPWPGCQRWVTASQWGCRDHWFALPPTLRRAIGRAYREGLRQGIHPSDLYWRCHRAAIAYAKEASHGRD